MFPNSYHHPAFRPQISVCLLVHFNISLDFRNPEIPVQLGLDVAVRASVPEASVDENGQFPLFARAPHARRSAHFLRQNPAETAKRQKQRQNSGKNKYFYLNLENIETKSLLLQAEIQKTMDFMKKYPVFQSFVKELKSISSPIIIFGSFARFSADRNSDVDMLVVSDKKIELPSHLLPHKIHEINITEDNFIKAFKEGETIIEKIKENHIILNNHSFFLNLMWNKYAR